MWCLHFRKIRAGNKGFQKSTMKCYTWYLWGINFKSCKQNCSMLGLSRIFKVSWGYAAKPWRVINECVRAARAAGWKLCWGCHVDISSSTWVSAASNHSSANKQGHVKVWWDPSSKGVSMSAPNWGTLHLLLFIIHHLRACSQVLLRFQPVHVWKFTFLNDARQLLEDVGERLCGARVFLLPTTPQPCHSHQGPLVLHS